MLLLVIYKNTTVTISIQGVNFWDLLPRIRVNQNSLLSFYDLVKFLAPGVVRGALEVNCFLSRAIQKRLGFNKVWFWYDDIISEAAAFASSEVYNASRIVAANIASSERHMVSGRQAAVTNYQTWKKGAINNEIKGDNDITTILLH